MPSIRRWIKEPFPGLSHGLGVGLSIAATIVLLVAARGRALHVAGFATYGSSLIVLYSASALVHSVHCSPRTEEFLERLDYSGIFLLIAGTYTPICLITLRGPWGGWLLVAIWAMALTGIATVWLIRTLRSRLRTVLYVAMGWLAVVAEGKLVESLPAAAIAWLVAGGLIYSIGAIVFFTDRPHLWPGRFAAHDLWHLMVLAGSACHFILIFRYVTP